MNFKEKFTLITTSVNHAKKLSSKNALGIKSAYFIDGLTEILERRFSESFVAI
jgi:hypothetical protein